MSTASQLELELGRAEATAQFVEQCVVELSNVDCELEYDRSALDGFVRGAWPVDGEPLDVAAEFAGSLVRQRCNARVVFVATHEWLTLAEQEGLEIDWESEPLTASFRSGSNEYADAARLVNVSDFECFIAPNDSELGAAVVAAVRPGDTAIQPGDVVLTSGPGGDVAFLRYGDLS